MKIYVNTGDFSRDHVIRGHLNDRGYSSTPTRTSNPEAFTHQDSVGFYVNDTQDNLELLAVVRQGKTTLCPFTPFTVFSVQPRTIWQSPYGVSRILSGEFTLNCIDRSIAAMINPTRDFIDIPDIYCGPERRRQQHNSLRSHNRRCRPHREERRYVSVKEADGKIIWRPTASHYILRQILTDHHAAIRQSRDRQACVDSLVKTLQAWHFSPERIAYITGVRL